MKYKQLLALVIALLSALTTFPVMAAVIYSGRLDLHGPDFSIDINKDGNIDLTASWSFRGGGNGFSVNSYDFETNYSTTMTTRFLNTELSGFSGFPGAKAPLSYGELIGGALPGNMLWSFNSNDAMLWNTWNMWGPPPFITYSGIWNNQNDKYLGFELIPGLDTFYGWIHLNVNASNDVLLVDYAYENVSRWQGFAGFSACAAAGCSALWA